MSPVCKTQELRPLFSWFEDEILYFCPECDLQRDPAKNYNITLSIKLCQPQSHPEAGPVVHAGTFYDCFQVLTLDTCEEHASFNSGSAPLWVPRERDLAPTRTLSLGFSQQCPGPLEDTFAHVFNNGAQLHPTLIPG